MADFGKLTLTAKGKEALLNAHNGMALRFTKIAMGSGVNSGGYESLTDLVDNRASVAISNGEVNSAQGTYTVEGYFTNEDITEGFTWTEVGLFFEGGDGSDVLYAAANAKNGDYIPATTDSRFAKYLRIATAVGNATNISIADSGSQIYTDTVTFSQHVSDTAHQHSNSFITHDGTGKKYRIGLDATGEYVQLFADGVTEKKYLASKEALDNQKTLCDEHNEDKSNPHNVTKEQIGLGKVPNVATNDQTPTYTQASALTNLTSGEKMSVAFGKIAKAIAEFILHLANKSNPHEVTAAQVGAAEANHTHPEQKAMHGIITAGNGAAYTATVDGITLLKAGASFTMIPHTVSTSSTPTLNVNGLGAKTIRRRLSSGTASTTAGHNASWLGANEPVQVTYDGTYWIADLAQPNAADIYGTLAVSKGGTGSGNGATGLANLFAAGSTVISSYQYGDTLPDAGTPGRIFFKKVSS